MAGACSSSINRLLHHAGNMRRHGQSPLTHIAAAVDRHQKSANPQASAQYRLSPPVRPAGLPIAISECRHTRVVQQHSRLG